MSLTERQNNIGLPIPIDDALLAAPYFLHPLQLANHPGAGTPATKRARATSMFLVARRERAQQRENNLWRKTARRIIYRWWAEVAGCTSRGHDHLVIYHPGFALLFLRVPCLLQASANQPPAYVLGLTTCQLLVRIFHGESISSRCAVIFGNFAGDSGNPPLLCWRTIAGKKLSGSER